MQSDQTTPPKRIWADPPETFDGMDVWRSEPGGKGVEYILASEHAALIREAEARGMERAATECDRLAQSYTRSLALYADDDSERRKVKWGASAVSIAAENIRAAALRGEKEPK